MLTGAGRQLILRLAHERDQLSGTVNPTHGLGDSADTACDRCRASDQSRSSVPLFSSRRESLMWSDHSGSLRLVRMHRDWRPGEGAHPGRLFGGFVLRLSALLCGGCLNVLYQARVRAAPQDAVSGATPAVAVDWPELRSSLWWEASLSLRSASSISLQGAQWRGSHRRPASRSAGTQKLRKPRGRS